MEVVCPRCHQIGMVDVSLEIGQHVICPFCHNKFSYSQPQSTRSFNLLKIIKNNWRLSIVCIISLILLFIGMVNTPWYKHYKNESDLKAITSWYEHTLDYNGLKERLYYSKRIPDGIFFDLCFDNDARIEFYHDSFRDHLSYPRSMSKGFAKDLITARAAMEELQKRLHQNK